MTSLFESLAEIEKQGRAVALCTVIRTRGATPRHAGSRMLVYPDGHIEGSIGGGEVENRVRQEAALALREGAARTLSYRLADPAAGDAGVCGGEMEIFVEPILPRPALLVIGGGHVGRAVAQLGKFLGMRVVVSDDRPEFCTPEAVPAADAYVPGPMAELPLRMAFNAQTYVVLTTRGVAVDVEGLPALLDQPWAYLGVIGSRKRWQTAFKELEARGVKPDVLRRVHSPLGLELNAETPEEIAVSILAEIIMVRRGGTGESMHQLMENRSTGNESTGNQLTH